MIKITLVAVCGMLLALQLKSVKVEYAISISLVVSLFLLFSIMSQVESVVKEIQQMIGQAQVQIPYLGTILKMLGFTYVAEFAAGLCRDAGFTTIAVQIEMVAKLSILALGIPIIATLLDTISVLWT